MSLPALPKLPPAEDSFTDVICKAQKDSHFDSITRKFLPLKQISLLVNDKTVRKELGNGPHNDEMVQWVVLKAPRVFLATYFHHYKFDDERLESEIRDLGGVSDVEKLGSYSKEAFHSSIWTTHKLSNFCDEMWKLTAPVFDLLKNDYDLCPKTTLPFIQKDYDVKEGAFSHVAIKEMKLVQTPGGAVRLATERRWEKESRVLKAIKGLKDGYCHPHIIQYLGSMRRGSDRYFMFPWAEGGSLRQSWIEKKQQIPTTALVLEALTQLLGVADGLKLLHDPDSTLPGGEEAADLTQSNKSIRHGDIKPENLLWFAANDQKQGRVLKIADMGLAKQHLRKTKHRHFLTTTGSSTIEYESPEVLPNAGPLSRLYDIWSMGCVMLEYILWMLYGYDGLSKFHDNLERRSGTNRQFYRKHVTESGVETVTVHPVVQHWIDRIREEHPECKGQQPSALKDLLYVVEEHLLVVNLPSESTGVNHKSGVIANEHLLKPPVEAHNQLNPPTETQRSGHVPTGHRNTAMPSIRSTDAELDLQVRGRPDLPPRYRATAEELCTHIRRILIKAENDESYAVLCPDIDYVDPPVTPSIVQNDYPVESDTEIRENYRTLISKDWQFQVDNGFPAHDLVDSTGTNATQNTARADLCARCSNFDFHESGFATTFAVPPGKSAGPACDLCALFLSACNQHDVDPGSSVNFIKEDSILRLSDTGTQLPVLSILGCLLSKHHSKIQLGLTPVPNVSQSILPRLSKLWLDDCDRSHDACRRTESVRLPTRLIDVGDHQSSRIRLVKTHNGQGLETDQRYLALSHPWGDTERFPAFCTYRTNKTQEGHGEECFLEAIDYGKLPATFRHAVDVTRWIGVRYLWIDSICILQGKDGDFSTEAARMEDVFSGAYCVIAASAAQNQHDGFLEKRTACNFVHYEPKGKQAPLYICEGVDDFGRDVLNSHLNSRGWVLQERALARRTIFFSKTQAYFECGEGICCETLTRMNHSIAGFIGDPHFPSRGQEANSKGTKIVYFQEIFKEYSKLGFKYDTDRPIGIAGLESRLHKAYKSNGQFGIFGHSPTGGFFHRSLLWKCENDASRLTRIDFSKSRSLSCVPSWSWMAYKGPIDYLDAPFGDVAWSSPDDICPPFAQNTNHPSDTKGNLAGANHPSIRAKTWAYDVSGREKDTARVHFDLEPDSTKRKYRCVVVGTARNGLSVETKQHFVLIVTHKGRPEDGLFERAGVASMLGSYIKWAEGSLPGMIA
ncbi:hypothetical protein Micbo1qcDRAFT_210763 [Microdochium bolleyi]|uniref:Protein kinase domain-containing protein n=1 Tax=Microdochium bolleyi TaxID=196109 RepID=A0A136JH77_9PEZI|nr:hypothetical protein Micbo1qcDRAFT_210763 [Microdochium bolleyi]